MAKNIIKSVHDSYFSVIFTILSLENCMEVTWIKFELLCPLCQQSKKKGRIGEETNLSAYASQGTNWSLYVLLLPVNICSW